MRHCLLWKPRALHGVAKGNISTFVLPLFNGLWPYNQATRFTGGSLLERRLRESDQEENKEKFKTDKWNLCKPR